MSHVRSGDFIVSTNNAGTPATILDKLYDRIDELDSLEVFISIPLRGMRLFLPQSAEKFKLITPFIGAMDREFMKRGTKVHYVPQHLSDVPGNMSEVKPGGVAIMMCTPPDGNGDISFGLSPLDASVVKGARLKIAQVNENVPFVKGEGMQCKLDDFDFIVDLTEELPTIDAGPPSVTDEKIAGLIMPYIPDGACIQLGIGGLANAVGSFLKDKKELGIHTEMFVESMVDLIECGAVTNSRKPFDKGISILGFGLGSKRMLDFADGNPAIESRSFGYVNDPCVIRQIDNFISINATMAVDLFGQCYSESIGFRQYSGTGGQADFVRGARHSKGGRSFVCTPSVMKKKDGTLASKIVIANEPGTVVTTLRSDVQYVVTEYGVAYLTADTIENRAKKLIGIAHPDFREQLTAEAKEVGIIS